MTLTAGTIQNGNLSSSGTFDLQGGTVSAALAGTGTAVVNGTVVLSGANSYSGSTQVAGTLRAGAANKFSPNSAFIPFAPATVDLNNFDQTIANLQGAPVHR